MAPCSTHGKTRGSLRALANVRISARRRASRAARVSPSPGVVMEPSFSLLSKTHPVPQESRSTNLRRARRRRTTAAHNSRWIPSTTDAQRSCRRSSNVTPTGPRNTGLSRHHQPRLDGSCLSSATAGLLARLPAMQSELPGCALGPRPRHGWKCSVSCVDYCGANGLVRRPTRLHFLHSRQDALGSRQVCRCLGHGHCATTTSSRAQEPSQITPSIRSHRVSGLSKALW